MRDCKKLLRVNFSTLGNNFACIIIFAVYPDMAAFVIQAGKIHAINTTLIPKKC